MSLAEFKPLADPTMTWESAYNFAAAIAPQLPKLRPFVYQDRETGNWLIRYRNPAEPVSRETLPTPLCMADAHHNVGGCYYCCSECDSDMHYCRGCGDPVTHDYREPLGSVYDGSAMIPIQGPLIKHRECV